MTCIAYHHKKVDQRQEATATWKRLSAAWMMIHLRSVAVKLSPMSRREMAATGRTRGEIPVDGND